MTTEEQEAKIAKDLAAARRIVYRSNLILRRIEAASGRLLEGNDNGNRPKSA